jgi:hypothetical protein
MRFPGFIGPSYTLQSVNIDCQNAVNLFPEINDLGTGKEREVGALVPTPGLRLLVTLGSSPVRALYKASNDQLFAVGGNKLYRVSDAWVATELGTLNSSEGYVSMADNGTYLVLVDGEDGYTWNIGSSAFAEITDPDYQSADQVTYQDGYFLFNRTGTQQFFFADDITNVDALDFASSGGRPDNLVGLISHSQQLYLFGTQSTEVFYNSGDADDPWQRVNGAIIPTGCIAAFSIAIMAGSIFWVGADENGQGIVYRTQGYQAQRVSNPAVESVIRGVSTTDMANARAWTYQQGGHLFYCLNFPGVDSTWVFDASTSMWHERKYLGLWSEERHRADCHAAAHGENVVGDYENGNLYALDPDTYTDNGNEIARIRTAPHLSKGLKNLFHSSFQLDMETGVGLDGASSTQGADPQVMLQWSDDGGHTWSNERWTDIGTIGRTKTRVIWRRLGCSRDRVYRVKVSDPVKVVLIGAEIMFEEGVA